MHSVEVFTYGSHSFPTLLSPYLFECYPVILLVIWSVLARDHEGRALHLQAIPPCFIKTT